MATRYNWWCIICITLIYVVVKISPFRAIKLKQNLLKELRTLNKVLSLNSLNNWTNCKKKIQKLLKTYIIFGRVWKLDLYCEHCIPLPQIFQNDISKNNDKKYNFLESFYVNNLYLLLILLDKILFFSCLYWIYVFEIF